MVTQAQLAALAMNAYTPAQVNRIDEEQFGWNRVAWLSRDDDYSPTGFGATVFQGPDNEFVIAFRGTDVEPVLNIDWVTGNTAALGIYNDQVRLAMQVVSNVMDAMPDGATIRLTGHSLGGGFASQLHE